MPTRSVMIVTPTYQHERFIAACIESVLSQTQKDWELVVVDDGSTDATTDIVQGFVDPRIKLMRRTHGGLAKLGQSYGIALDASRAPLVAVLEGDDAWPPDKLERQLADFEDSQVVLSYGAAALIDEFGCRYAVVGARHRSAERENRPVGSIVRPLAMTNFIIAPTVVVRRSALDLIGGFRQPPDIAFVDHPTWLRLAELGEFRYHPQVVGYWRRHPAQYTTASVGGRPPDGAYLREALSRHSRVSSVAKMRRRSHEREALNTYRRTLLAGSAHDVFRAGAGLLGTRRPRLVGAALLGMLMWSVGGDLEWLARAQGRVSWPSRRHLRQHQ
jgi:glycosyltransferase involved in cell wall biosynthesis